MKRFISYSFMMFLLSSCGVVFYNGDFYRPIRLVNATNVVDSTIYRNKKNNVSGLVTNKTEVVYSTNTDIKELSIDSLQSKINREELYFKDKLIYPNSIAKYNKFNKLPRSSALGLMGYGLSQINNNSLSIPNDNSKYSPRENNVIGYVKLVKNKTPLTNPIIIILAIICGLILLCLVGFLILITSFSPLGFG